MNQTNIIDFEAVRDQYDQPIQTKENTTDDLIQAIQNLIKRLREANPISAAS